MQILIDTHIFLWLLYDTKRIELYHLDILRNTNNNLYISSVSIAEIMIKKSVGKLDVEFDMDLVLDKLKLEVLDFDLSSASNIFSLPLHHRDPFDRMIISQAITNKIQLLSYDKKFKLYDCELL